MRAVIIGCGPSGPLSGGCHSISYAHARAMRQMSADIQLVAAASRKEKNIADFVAEFPGIQGYQDYRVMLAQEHPEFVSVCAFPPDRETMVQAALDAGAKWIWVEKPFAVSAGAARRMLKAAEAQGARLFVNFQRRFGLPFQWVKEAVANGRIGKLIGAQVTQPGNELINFGPHLIDAALNIMDVPFTRQPIRVLGAVEWSEGTYQGVPVEAQIAGTVHFTDGTRMVIEAGKQTAERVPVIRFDGEQGFAELRLSALDGEKGIARGRFIGESEVTVLEADENFHHGATEPNLYVDRALKDILAAVATQGPSPIDAATVLPGLDILLALYASNRQQKMLPLPLEEEETPFAARP